MQSLATTVWAAARDAVGACGGPELEEVMRLRRGVNGSSLGIDDRGVVSARSCLGQA